MLGLRGRGSGTDGKIGEHLQQEFGHLRGVGVELKDGAVSKGLVLNDSGRIEH